MEQTEALVNKHQGRVYREELLLNCGTSVAKTIHALPQEATKQQIKDAILRNHSYLRTVSQCSNAYQQLHQKPILKYVDTSKPDTLYTDASKFGWAGVLTQSHTTVIDGKSTTTDHTVTFVSGLFRGSQLNWAALMKEAFAIYMSVEKFPST